MTTKSKDKAPKSGRIYQLEITLQEIRPRIWRRLLVSEDVTLFELHWIIQAAMGWESYHLWSFDIGGEEYGEELDGAWGPPMEDARRVNLNQVASRGDTFTYLYDFGDSWEHRVRVERIIAAEPGHHYPICIAAERACPPEDSGGIWGYEELLNALADPRHPDHDMMTEWVGDDFDPEAVDLDEINQRLAHAGPVSQATSPAEATLHGMREMAENILGEFLAENPDATLDELNAVLQAATAGLNLRPIPEFGGLSPVEVNELLTADLSPDLAEPGSTIQLNESLPLAALEASSTFHNARLLLEILDARGEVRTTPKGNLPRVVVYEFYERMIWPPDILGRDWLADRKIINEDDIFPLHIVHILLDLAGLIKRRKGVITLTRRGQELLDEDRAGELFALLFRTHFRRLNLGYLDRSETVPGLQQTIGYTLYQFGRVGVEWRLADELTVPLILPAVYDEIPPDPDFDRAASILSRRFLRPLEGFGLAEIREQPRAPGVWGSDYLFRKTPLFDRFFSFHLSKRVDEPGDAVVWH
jgi:hypothetical protein